PAISPDGRWLVYVPIARAVDSVGPAFAAHAAPVLEAVPLASALSAAPIKIELPLPGPVGQPAFAKDGRWLYFVQFFADTNHDGMVDGADHGVLFRIPLVLSSSGATIGPPEQLTLASWNCEYPAPFVDRLVATCSRDASLDLYSMPLDGEVPSEWTTPMLTSAVDGADTLAKKQLLRSRLLARETTTTRRRLAMLGLVMVHLEREEFRAARYYAEQVAALHDAATKGISVPLQMLVEERRAERHREQGRLVEGFRADARARLDKLRTDRAQSPVAASLTHIARSAIFDALGDKGQARAELEAVTIDETTPAPVVEAYYRRADGLYRELDDPEALIAVGQRLSVDAGLSPDLQLRYARAAVAAMVRGLPHADADARLARERAGTTDVESELAFAIDLARDLLAIGDTPEAARDALLALYAAQTRPGRRRVLVEDAAQRPHDIHADDVVFALLARDIHDVKRGTHERGEVENLYERFVLGRAYGRAKAKQYAEARADFDSVESETGSFEAAVMSIDMALKLGEPPETILARFAERRVPPEHFNLSKAYLLARQLPKLEGDAHGSAAATAIAALHASWAELKRERVAQALYGALLHEEYLRTGELAAAEKANVHYLVALELVGDDPRFRSTILGQLGLLHTDVGNHRIALGYLLERNKLPYSDNSEGLDVLLSMAQAFLHVGREADAAASGEATLAMIARNPPLERYRLLALDWTALASLAAGKFARALALYDEEIPALDALSGPAGERSRIVTRLSRAAAATGANAPARALVDLDYVDDHVRAPGAAKALEWPHATTEQVAREYQLISNGLRANANRALERYDAEAQAIGARRQILERQLGETNRVETARAEMLTDAQLALNASERHDPAATSAWLERALARADDLRSRANGRSDKDDLDVLWLAAALTTSAKAPLVADLPKRLDEALAEMAGRRDPSLRSYQRWFEIYGALVSSAPATPGGRP
ncbi:MAG: hypothetical protein FWD17_11705, partial [Polyangiaceae bacterium]|nr:hypothetical protein [Polyangiaceae bacterium]